MRSPMLSSRSSESSAATLPAGHRLYPQTMNIYGVRAHLGVLMKSQILGPLFSLTVLGGSACAGRQPPDDGFSAKLERGCESEIQCEFYLGEAEKRVRRCESEKGGGEICRAAQGDYQTAKTNYDLRINAIREGSPETGEPPSLEVYAERCEDGDADACFEVGNSGADKIPSGKAERFQDRAQSLWSVECQKGKASSCLSAALLSFNDEQRAFWERAAALGEPRAFLYIAERARGGERRRYLGKACDGGVQGACVLLEREAMSPEQAARHEEIAAEELSTGRCDQQKVDRLREQVQLVESFFPSPEYLTTDFQMVVLEPGGNEFEFRVGLGGDVGVGVFSFPYEAKLKLFDGGGYAVKGSSFGMKRLIEELPDWMDGDHGVIKASTGERVAVQVTGKGCAMIFRVQPIRRELY
jgi:hypothetical protein